MATILISSDGRRCDATCHQAERAECRCICNGTYHGKPNAAALIITEGGGELVSAGNVRLADVQTSMSLDVERVHVERAPRRKRPHKPQGGQQAALPMPEGA